MQSILFVHSKNTKKYAENITRNCKEVEFYEVTSYGREILDVEHNKDVVIGIGGGKVIDAAKILSRDNRCIAYPTTACGSAMTSHSVIWDNKKISIYTKKPILKRIIGADILLPNVVIESTIVDALSHAVESLWSKNLTSRSRIYAVKAISLIKEYFKCGSVYTLISAGNSAGQAIEITGTNIIHATSYPITLKYNIRHGSACGMLLPIFTKYMNYKLPKLIVSKLSKFNFLEFKNFDRQMIAQEAVKYANFSTSCKEINKKNLINILKV